MPLAKILHLHTGLYINDLYSIPRARQAVISEVVDAYLAQNLRDV